VRVLFHEACSWLCVVVICVCLNVSADVVKHTDAPPFPLTRSQAIERYSSGSGNAYGQLARLALGKPIDEEGFRSAIASIDERGDCADFRLHPVLRLLYQFGENPNVSEGLLEEARRSVLGFKYWPDEPGVDSMCTWSENHQILFAAGGYLAGQLFPDAVFTNSGQTGREKMAVHRPRVLRWLDLRFRSGFSEWLSNVYYDEDLAPLVNLVDFCEDEDIARRAAMVIDLLLTDMAVNSFRGTFGSTHGRTYESEKKSADAENTADTQALMFGTRPPLGHGNMSATCFALSDKYRMPRVIRAIANDSERPEMVNRQRTGIRIAEAKQWGLGFRDFEDGMVFLSLEAYAHPRTINLMMDMLDAYNWWENEFFEDFNAKRGLLKTARKLRLLPLVAKLFEWDITRNVREEANLYTYRTPDYMLSSAQDYRKGYGGDQHHIWQATLGPEATCFTTHPARRKGPSPNYWVGSGVLPRVAQVRNVVLAIYRITKRPALYVPNRLMFTHAWVPKDQFDEVVERDGWIFARLGEGYLALRSQHPYHWQTEPGKDQNGEVIVPGQQNVWLCELGRKEVDGDFADFMARILAAPLSFGRLKVSYHSPTQGKLEFGWRGALRQDGCPVPLDEYARYENPYTYAAFPAQEVALRCGDHWLRLNWDKGTREANEFL